MEPTLRQLEYLVEIADRGTFVAAAEALRVSQPALSAQVASAERRLGVTVFERSRQGATVTPEGQPLIDAARRILDGSRELMRLASERDGDLVGALTIGVIPTIAPYLLPVIVREVRRRYPSAELYLREERTADLVRSIHDGDVDFGVLAAPVPELDGSLEAVQLATEPFVLAVPAGTHSEAARTTLAPTPVHSASVPAPVPPPSPVPPPPGRSSGVRSSGVQSPGGVAGQRSLDEFTDLPMLLLEDGHCLREHAASACDVLGVRQFGTVQANGLASLTQMVAAGMGATLLPASAIGVEARSGSGVAIHRLAPPVPTRSIVVAWRPSAARRPHYLVLADALAGPVSEATTLAQ